MAIQKKKWVSFIAYILLYEPIFIGKPSKNGKMDTILSNGNVYISWLEKWIRNLKKICWVFLRDKPIISILDNYNNMRYHMYENMPEMECVYFQNIKKSEI